MPSGLCRLTQRRNHIRRRPRDDERPKPLIRRRDRYAEHADVQREDLHHQLPSPCTIHSTTLGCTHLTTVHPRNPLPRSTIDQPIQIHAHHCEVARATTTRLPGCCCGRGIRFEDVSTEIPHGEGSDEGAPDEAGATTESFDEPDAENDHAEGFGEAVEARGEELGVGAGYAEGFEDSGARIDGLA